VTYVNHDGRMDSFFRKLPETDDPRECIEFLVSMWRSKRECEAAVYGDASPPHGATTVPMLMAEDGAIEALMDALADTEEVAKPDPDLCAAAPDLLRSLKTLIAQIDEWERAVETVIGRPAKTTWGDLEAARRAIAKVEGRA